jgi:transcriptional regulator with PAS, ATPase and Fis domain
MTTGSPVQEAGKKMTKQSETLDFSGLISRDPKMKTVFELIDKVAATSSTVLVVGETGSGKELVARAIHVKSKRKDQPFIAINCAALSETLLESELFGHERGAFTGAFSRKHGLFEVADGGSIFLDEIAEMSPMVQTKLLRVLETKTFRRVGGTEPITVDVRLIVASQQDLRDAVLKGTFRNDLYYRLSTIAVSIPPLRERKGDITYLVDHFLDRLSAAHEKPRGAVSQEVLDVFSSYDWPGNVRELENVIERAYVLSSGGVLTLDDLPAKFRTMERVSTIDGLPCLEEIKKRHVISVLRTVSGNKTRAAEILGVDRKTLYRMLKSWNVELTLE